jgi:hypothetical protein
MPLVVLTLAVLALAPLAASTGAAAATLPSSLVTDSKTARWVPREITDLAQRCSAALNQGVLLQLAGGQRDYDVSGLYFASSAFARTDLRPRLVVSDTTGV